MRLTSVEKCGKTFHPAQHMAKPIPVTSPDPDGVYRFSTRDELHGIPEPEGAAPRVVWHRTVEGFGASIARKNSRTGKSLRQYIARFKDVDGKDQKKAIGKFEEIQFNDAMREAMDLRGVAKHERKTGIKPLPTLKKALDYYITDRHERLADDTVEHYRAKWNYLAAWHDENVITLGMDFWADRYRDISLENGRATAQAVLRIAHSVYKDLVRDGRLAINPVAQVASKQQIYAKGQPKREFIRRQDLPKFWAWIETRAHVTVRDWCRVAMLTGLRDSVISSLRWENVDIENRLLRVPAEERGNKAKRLVWVPISNMLYELVIAPRYAAGETRRSPWVLPSMRKADQPLTDIRGTMATLFAETGINVSPHRMRRTFATIAKAATGDTLLVSRMLTHSSKSARDDDAPAVTAGYVFSESEDLREGFEKQAALLKEYVKPSSKLTAEPAPAVIQY